MGLDSESYLVCTAFLSILFMTDFVRNPYSSAVTAGVCAAMAALDNLLFFVLIPVSFLASFQNGRANMLLSEKI
jgi:hypothetical protein